MGEVIEGVREGWRKDASKILVAKFFGEIQENADNNRKRHTEVRPTN